MLNASQLRKRELRMVTPLVAPKTPMQSTCELLSLRDQSWNSTPSKVTFVDPVTCGVTLSPGPRLPPSTRTLLASRTAYQVLAAMSRSVTSSAPGLTYQPPSLRTPATSTWLP